MVQRYSFSPTCAIALDTMHPIISNAPRKKITYVQKRPYFGYFIALPVQILATFSKKESSCEASPCSSIRSAILMQSGERYAFRLRMPPL